MDGNARAEPCTRKLAWFRSATCMVGLRNLHGWTPQLAWFSSPKCMVQLTALHGWTFKTWFVSQNDTHADHHSPPRQEVLPPPLKLRRTSRVLILRQILHPRHPRQNLTRPPCASSRHRSAHGLNRPCHQHWPQGFAGRCRPDGLKHQARNHQSPNIHV